MENFFKDQKTVHILYCFLGYLSAIFLYALIYFRVYKKHPHSFLFAKDIRASQINEIRSAEQQTSPKLRKEVRILEHLERSLTADGKLPIGIELELDAGEIYKIRKQFKVLAGPPVGGVYGDASVMEFHIDFVSSELEFSFELSPPMFAWQKWKKPVMKMIAGRKRKLGELEALIKDSMVEFSSILWSFWDFAYFSCITQTTVGYGDILPNRTVIRILAASQILVGYIILVVLLNIVLSNQT